MVKGLFRSIQIVMSFIAVYLTPTNGSSSGEHTNKSDPMSNKSDPMSTKNDPMPNKSNPIKHHVEVLNFDPLNDPILLCMYAMDAFTPIIYDGGNAFVLSNDLIQHLKLLNQEHSLLEEINEKDRVNEMIAYIEAYYKACSATKLKEAFSAIIALSRGELDESMRKYIAPDGKSIVFELGYTNHTMKGEVIIDENKPESFIFNVYNSGGGLEYHPCQQYSKGKRIKFSPYVSFLAKRSDLDENFVNLLAEIRSFTESPKKYIKGRATTAVDLYIGIFASLLLPNKNEKYRDFIYSQRSGSCALASWHPFFTAKFGNDTYKKIRLAVVIGIMQRQLNSPGFDFLNHDYSDEKRLNYDFHEEEQLIERDSQYSFIFGVHLINVDYRKGSPKRTTKRDAIMAYEQIIRWLHRQNEKIVGEKTLDKKVPGGPGKALERSELHRKNQENRRYHALFKENIERIEELFKVKKDEYLAEVDAANEAKRVAFEFQPLLTLVLENRNFDNEDREILRRYNKAMGSPASHYFICTWGSVDDFISSCDMFMQIRDKYTPRAKGNSLYLASYILHLSKQITKAAKRWENLPEYKQRIKEILDTINGLKEYVFAKLMLEGGHGSEVQGLQYTAPVKPSTKHVFESQMAYSGLIDSYFNIWKYYYANVANAGIDVSSDIRCYEIMLKNILKVPESRDIDLTGEERSAGPVENYYFYDKNPADRPEANSEDQIKLDNLICYRNASERENIVAKLFEVAHATVCENFGGEIKEDEFTNESREALITTVLASTSWMLYLGKTLNLTKIDEYYYNLLNMVKQLNAISNKDNEFKRKYKIVITIDSSGIESLSSRLFGASLFTDYSDCKDDAVTNKVALDMEGYLKNPATLASYKTRHDIYRYILDRSRVPGDANFGEFRRGIEIFNAVFKTELEGLKAKTKCSDRESSLRIIALCFLASKRMKACMKDSLENIGDDTENLRLGSADFIQGLASEKKGQKELECLFTFLEAAGETIEGPKNDAFAKHSKMDIRLAVRIHYIISKNLGILEKYVHKSELFAFIPRFYENYLESINEFEVENGEDFDFYPYSIRNCEFLEPSGSSGNPPDNPVNISYFGGIGNLHQQVKYRDVTFIANAGGVFCIGQENGVKYVVHIQDSMLTSAYSKKRANSSSLFGSKEKLYFMKAPSTGNKNITEAGNYKLKIMLKGGNEYGKIFRRDDKGDPYYFELTNKEAFCLKEYSSNGIFRIGIPSLKERVIENCYDETCVKNLPLIDNFAQGTDVLALLESDGNGDSFHFLPIYGGRDNGTCDCFFHCNKARQEYDLYFEGRKYSILDIHEDGTGNVSIENRKYYELPILFVKPANSNEDIGDERVFMACPTSLIQDDQPGSGDMDAPKLVFIECNCNFVPVIRDTFHAAVLFRMCLEYKMYVEALECMLHMNAFTASKRSIGDVIEILRRVVKLNKHRDLDAYFFRAAVAYMIETYNTCLGEFGFKACQFTAEYSRLLSVYSLMPSYLQCMAKSLLIDFQDLRLSRIFMYCQGQLAIFKNNKSILRGKLEKSLKSAIFEVLENAKNYPSTLSNDLVNWVQHDVLARDSGSRTSFNKMPRFMTNLQSPENLEKYCLGTFKKSFYDGGIYRSLVGKNDSQGNPESAILCISTKREAMKRRPKAQGDAIKNYALYDELYNAAKNHVDWGNGNSESKNIVVNNALTNYWNKEIAKIQDPRLLNMKEVIDYFISINYDDKYNRETNRLFREDLSLEASEDSTPGLAETVAQAEHEYDAIDKSIDLKFVMDSLLNDRNDFLRKKLSQRILLGMNGDELKRHFKVKDAESLYRMIWKRFIEENKGRSETIRELTIPSKRALSMIDKIMILLCGHAENEADVVNVEKDDEETLRHIIDHLERGEAAVSQRLTNISKLRVVVPCLTMYATHKLQKIPVIVLSSGAIMQNTVILHEAMQRAFGKNVFRIGLASVSHQFKKMQLLSTIILLRKIRDAGDVVICTLKDIQLFQKAREELQRTPEHYTVELKMLDEILRTIKDESLGIVDDNEKDSLALFARTVKLGA